MSAPTKTVQGPHLRFGDEIFELDFLDNIEREHWVQKGSIKRNVGKVVSRDFKRENGKWSTSVKDVI